MYISVLWCHKYNYMSIASNCIIRPVDGPLSKPKPMNRSFRLTIKTTGARDLETAVAAWRIDHHTISYPDTTCLGLPGRTAAPERPPVNHPNGAAVLWQSHGVSGDGLWRWCFLTPSNPIQNDSIDVLRCWLDRIECIKASRLGRDTNLIRC